MINAVAFSGATTWAMPGLAPSAGPVGGGFPPFSGADLFMGSPELLEDAWMGAPLPSFLAAHQFGLMGGQGLVPGMSPYSQASPFSNGFGNNFGAFPGLPMQRPAGLEQPGAQGGPIELREGESYTTPMGDVITFEKKKHKVTVNEPGGGGEGSEGPDDCGCEGSFALAGAATGPDGSSAAFALAGKLGGQPQGPQQTSAPSRPRQWSVHGDPHITNPDGSKGEFSKGEKGARGSGMFTLQDGTRVVMEAKSAKGVVKRVLIFPPGTQLSGFDPNKTTDWGDGRSGKFSSQGTVAQTQGMGGGLQMPLPR